MQYVMLRETGAAAGEIVPYFTVLLPDGTPAFRIIGEKNPFTGKLALVDCSGRERGRVLRVGTPLLSCHTVWQAGRKRAVITRNLAAPRRPYRFYGVPWKTRGDCFSGSFDVVDARGAVIMTHGRGWYCGRACVCVEARRREDVVCLLIAAVVDSTPGAPSSFQAKLSGLAGPV